LYISEVDILQMIIQLKSIGKQEQSYNVERQLNDLQ